MNYSSRLELATAIDTYFRSFYTRVEAVTSADLLLIFGRSDVRLAEVGAEVWSRQIVKNILITGGVGKDSGPLLSQLKFPESSYLGYVMHTQFGVPFQEMIVETASSNGGENCRNSINLIQTSGIDASSLILVAYPASLYRLYQLFMSEGRKAGFTAEYQLVPSAGPLNLDNPHDQDELIAEFLRLIEWPEKGWLDPIDLPADLVTAVLQTKPK